MSSPKVYWTNPFKFEFQISITSCTKVEDHYHIEIDNDVIRPEGGGQAGDRGKIRLETHEIEIVNTVATTEGPRLVSRKPIDITDRATLSIDQNWRQGMMRNHTSEHLFVSELKRLRQDIELGYIWIDGEKGTVELLGDELDFELLTTAERNIQRYILEDRPVESSIIDAKDLTPDVRAREGVNQQHEKLRIVSVQGLDQSACSGLHVQRTGDIGIFKIIDFKYGQGSTRIEFTSHSNAIEAISSLYNIILSRKHNFPFEMQQIGHVLDKAKRSADTREELLSFIVELINESNPSEIINGISFRSYSLPGFESKELHHILQSIKLHGPNAILLFSNGIKCNFIFWTNDLEEAAAFYISDIIGKLRGKGGGSKEVYTGGFNEVANPHDLYKRIIEGIQDSLRS